MTAPRLSRVPHCWGLTGVGPESCLLLRLSPCLGLTLCPVLQRGRVKELCHLVHVLCLACMSGVSGLTCRCIAHAPSSRYGASCTFLVCTLCTPLPSRAFQAN